MSIKTGLEYIGYIDSWTDEERLTDEEIVRCRDCKHGHITISGDNCKWCDIMATHDPEDPRADPPNGYDPEPYFSADFFCAFGERREPCKK